MPQQQSSPSQSLFYNSVMAAPMVRVSTLAFRLLCAHHGSTVVFTEELVAAKLMKCKRRYLPQVDFLLAQPDHASMPEKFVEVLNKLSRAEENSSSRGTAEKLEDSKNDKIVAIIKKWMKMFPFLEQTIFAGRVEGIYVGHQQKPQQATAAAASETEEPSIQGEMVFTTLAERVPSSSLSSTTNSANNNDNDNQDSSTSSLSTSIFKNHCQHQIIFSKKEAGKPLIGQIGAADGNVAVAGFSLLAPFVSAADTNMGCPKAFSVKNGMGAALMANKSKATEIMKGLSDNFPYLPVSYKTRLFEDVKESFQHLQGCFAATGNRLHAFTIHSRNRPQRSETAPLYQDAAQLVQMIRGDENLKNLCLIFNGSVGMRPMPRGHTNDGNKNDDYDEKQSAEAEALSSSSTTERKEIDMLLSSSLCGNENVLNAVSSYGFNGALLARSSMWKPSVFLNQQQESQIPFPADSLSPSSSYAASLHPVIKTLLREFQSLAICYAACGDQVRLLKYHLTRAIPEYQSAEGVSGRGDDAKRLGNQINQMIWFPIRDGKTLQDFSKALQFSQDEIDAMNWMTDLMNWRRGSTMTVVNESWDPLQQQQQQQRAATMMMPSRRERE